MVRYASFHRRRYAQGFVNASEVVLEKAQGDHVSVVVDLL
jgi:hypothetical protein